MDKFVALSTVSDRFRVSELRSTNSKDEPLERDWAMTIWVPLTAVPTTIIIKPDGMDGRTQRLFALGNHNKQRFLVQEAKRS